MSVYGFYAQDRISGSHEGEKDKDKEIYSDMNKEQTALGINWRWLCSNDAYLLFTPYINTNAWSLSSGYLWNKEAFKDNNKENMAGMKVEYFQRIDESNKLTLKAEYKNIFAKYSKSTDFDTLLKRRNLSSLIRLILSPIILIKFQLPQNIHTRRFDIWHINFGLRSDYFKYLNKASIDPRLSSSITIDEKTNVNLAIGLFTQYPAFYKIFLDDANKNLKPAKAIHYIAGIEHSISEDAQIKVEAYYKDLQNLAVKPSDTSNVYKTNGNGYAYGLELSLTKKMSDNLYLLFNYSYSKSKRKDNTDSAFYDFKYDRPHAR